MAFYNPTWKEEDQDNEIEECTPKPWSNIEVQWNPEDKVYELYVNGNFIEANETYEGMLDMFELHSKNVFENVDK